VAEPQQLAKAQLIELDSKLKNPKADGKKTTVQFNPETLKLSYANQLGQPGAGGKTGGAAPSAAPAPAGDQAGGAARQYVGSSTTKLSLQLWFDVTGQGGDAADVTKLTEGVAYFMKPQPLGDNKELLPPNVRLLWGAFQFDGTFDSLEETFEFFSNDGRPLRANLSLTMSQQQIQLAFTPEGGAPFGGAGGGPGTRPLTPAPAGATLQGLAAGIGAAASWQSIAAANGIENPRLLQPGQLVDLNLSVSVGG
jgi:Contractile injection system tube protein